MTKLTHAHTHTHKQGGPYNSYQRPHSRGAVKKRGDEPCTRNPLLQLKKILPHTHKRYHKWGAEQERASKNAL